MAVYTQITDEELTVFLETYDIGAILSYKGIAEGVENSNYLLHTTSGIYILTLFEKRVDAADLPYFMTLMEHLAQSGIQCPQPVRRKDGEILGRLAARPAAIVTFLDGVAVSKPTRLHCSLLGEAMAKLHLAGQKFDATRKNSLSVTGWRPLFNKVTNQANSFMPGLRELIEAELDYLENNWPDNLPIGVIHADLFPDNVFFLQNKLAGFIDFYFSCNDILAFDVAICINAWCFDSMGNFDETKAASLLSGYQKYRKFSEEENRLFPTLVRGASIRFLITRLYDWVNTQKSAIVTPKDPGEYIAILRFHQSITDFCVYGVAADE